MPECGEFFHRSSQCIVLVILSAISTYGEYYELSIATRWWCIELRDKAMKEVIYTMNRRSSWEVIIIRYRYKEY